MSGKILIQIILATSMTIACATDVLADTKANRKHTLHCYQKKHLLMRSCPVSQPMDMISHGGGSGGGGRTGSDLRLKHNLKLVGKTVYGLPLYDFEYNGKRGTYEGVMAQDVLKVKPEAVSTGPDGYYMVNYKMLGLKFKRIQ